MTEEKIIEETPKKNQEETEEINQSQKITDEVKEEIGEIIEEENPIDTLKKLSEEIENLDVKNVDDEKLNELTQNLIKEEKPKFIEINDEYIKNQAKEIQKILKPIKGEILSEKALKNYINAEQYIEKLKKQKTTPQPTTQPTPEPKQEINTNAIDINNSQDIYDFVFNTLKTKYDMPELDDKKLAISEFSKYLEDYDPVKYTQFKKDLEKTIEIADEQTKQIKELAENWEKIAMENIQNDINDFKSKLEKIGINFDDLNLNLEFDNEFYNEYIYKNILFNKNNQANKDVVEYIGNIPVIKKGKVLEKLLTLNFDKIIELKNKNLPLNQNSLTSTTSTEYKYPPAQSTGSGRFSAGKSSMISSLIDTPANKLNDEDINRALEELKRQLI